MNGHPLSSRETGLSRFRGPAGAMSKGYSDGREAVPLSRNRPKPAWRVLYAVFAVTVLHFVVADVELPAGGWRILTECLCTALVIGTMALWVRANRAALALPDNAPDGGETLHIDRGHRPAVPARPSPGGLAVAPVGVNRLSRWRVAEWAA